ncbi:hypothetical protein [Microtetraspora sp. NBRC 13810]|nr:hypothetical protein [Microtetraspora sp. NBRC 13810]
MRRVTHVDAWLDQVLTERRRCRHTPLPHLLIRPRNTQILPLPLPTPKVP